MVGNAFPRRRVGTAHFAEYGFKAHFQCAKGFEDWLDQLIDVKCIPFEDCKPIPSHILKSAYDWLGKYWDGGHRVLIHCAAGESRSVSIAIGLLALKTGLPFKEACKKVFNKNPYAYPHPKTLVSVARYCGLSLDIDLLTEIYNKIVVPPPFPWGPADIAEAVHDDI